MIITIKTETYELEIVRERMIISDEEIISIGNNQTHTGSIILINQPGDEDHQDPKQFLLDSLDRNQVPNDPKLRQYIETTIDYLLSI